MSKIRPADGERNATAYRFESAPEENMLEAFLWKLLLLTAIAYFIWTEKITISFGPMSVHTVEVKQEFATHRTDLFGLLDFQTGQTSGVRLEESAIDNLTFAIDPSFARRYAVPPSTIARSAERCSTFVKRFSPVAVAEMRRFGIPASILLAQALLASNAGEDSVAQQTNNFFQRNCTAQNCRAEHCPDPVSADAPQWIDVFPNLWGSFRAQSQYFYNTEPYVRLIHGVKKDFRTWARVLDASGYSPDAHYGEKLTAIIQSLQLETFDNR